MTYGQGGYGQPGGAYPPTYFHQRPSAVTWFNVYCILMALLYAIVSVVCAFILSSPEIFEVRGGDLDPVAAKIQAIVMLVVSVPLMMLFAAAPALPRRPWVWVYDIVLICLGMTSVCCMPATIPLLIFWIKPDAKAWFGRVA